MSFTPPNEPDNTPFPMRMRRLIILWGACCMSPIMYLAIAMLIKSAFMHDGGWLPMEPFTWSRVMMGLVVLVVLLQVLHIAVKVVARRKLTQLADHMDGFTRLLTRRTFILIAISETAVATGFVLFLLQGTFQPILGSGIAAMLLYAQSHPRLALPPVNFD